MNLTPNLRLPYPNNDDPGDGALDLQILAEAADAAMAAQIIAFRKTINKPCRVATLSTNTSGMTAGQEGSIFQGQTWTILYDSSTIAFPPTINPFDQRGMGEAPGVYHIGAYLSSQPTGAATVNSVRQLEIRATVPGDRTIFPATTTLMRGISTGFETGVGVHPLTSELEVYTPFPTVGVDTNAGTKFDAIFFHQNVASTVQINAGAVVWIWRAADVDVI